MVSTMLFLLFGKGYDTVSYPPQKKTGRRTCALTENQRQRIVQMEAAGHHIILFGKDVSWPVEAEDYFTADEIRDITAELRTYLAAIHSIHPML